MQGGLSLNGFGVVGKGVNGAGMGMNGESTHSRLDSKTIMIDQSKGELFSPSKGLKTMHRRLKKQFQIKINKDDFSEASLKDVRSVVMASPVAKFEPEEIRALKAFISEGGTLLLMAQEGGESDPNQHLSKLTSEYGVTPNNDCVVRTAYRKDYFHPKEVYISKASLTPEIDNYAGKSANATSEFNLDDQDVEEEDEEESNHGGLLDIVYPFGCTLTIDRPASPLITSGRMSFPANRALLTVTKVNKGLLLVMGSAKPFHDKYITKEDNMALFEACIKMLTATEVKVGAVENDRPELKDAVQVPDMEALAERLRCCLQEPEELPSDFSKLFDLKLFSYHTDMVPEAIKLYERLNVKHEPLSLIPPQFEVPLPPLQPAVFLPSMRDLPPPALDLFDLDQQFSGDTVQLAQLTNKCSDKDLDYYIVNAGRILDVTSKVETTEGQDVSAKQILEHIFKELVNYKKMDSDDPSHRDGRDSKNSTSLISPSPRSSSMKEFKSQSRQGSAGQARRSQV